VGLQTEFSFTLPKGFIGPDGTLHRQGTMRLSTARDEIEPLRDPRVSGPEDPYLTILVIARVVTELGSLPRVTVNDIEGLFAADLAFLQDLYGIINFGDPADVGRLQQSVLRDEPAPAVVAPEPVVAASSAAAVDADGEAAPRRSRGRIEEVGSRAES
jgi:hypothetical protein